MSPFFIGAARSAGGWRESICLQDAPTGCRQRRADSMFALWRKAFGGAGFACMGLQRWCLAKSFFTSPRVCMRVRARECMCKKRGAVGAESLKAL